MLLLTFYFLDEYFVLTGVSSSCFSTDSVSFECTDKFQGEELQLSVEIKACQRPVKIKTSLKINALDINWDYEFDASQDVAIPGFSVGDAGAFLHLEVTTLNNGNLEVKVYISLTMKLNCCLLLTTVKVI